MTEDTFVHKPFLDELENIGWEVIRLNRPNKNPQESYRESFADVVMKAKLKEALFKINDFLGFFQIFLAWNIWVTTEKVAEILLEKFEEKLNMKVLLILIQDGQASGVQQDESQIKSRHR